MMGSMARGMKAGAGKGFWREIGSGLEEAATKSSEIGMKDVKDIEAKDKELRKLKKDARKEWSEGNLKTALALAEVYDKEVASKVLLKEANIAGITKMEAIRGQIVDYYANGFPTAAVALMKNAYDAGALTKAEILEIIPQNEDIPTFLGGSGSDQLTG